MLKNLLTTAWRSLLKHKFFSLLHILGLSIGMAVFLLIAQYVRFERSYEQFLPNADNLYRVAIETKVNHERVAYSAENYPAVGPALVAEIPGVVGATRFYNLGYKNNVIVTYQDARPNPIALKHRRFLYADSSVFGVMGYRLVSGDPATALSQPLTAVISEHYAQMYFGNEEPIGKMLQMNDDDGNNELVKVTGVFENLPDNTHLKFDILFSYKTLYTRYKEAVNRYDHNWRRRDMYTFVALQPGIDPKSVEKNFPALLEKYKPDNQKSNIEETLFLQPLKSIHLTSTLAEEPEPNGDEKIVNFLFLIGIFVLVIAWINYVNLSTAKAMERAREVGIRKVMGAFRSQLIRQFITEAAIVNLVSIMVAFFLVALALPSFNSLSGIHLSFGDIVTRWYLLLLGALWLIGTTLSGLYPALVLSSFKPVTTLSGKLRHTTGGRLLRRSLVVIQFIASVALIAGTLIVFQQLRFMMSQDLGVNIDQVLVVERPGLTSRDRNAFTSAIDVFRNEVKTNPSVVAISASATVPGKQREYKAITKRYGAPDDQLVSLRFNSMDYEFLDVFQMKLLAGRVFDEQHVTDPDTSVVITESAAKLLGFGKPEDAVGQTLQIPSFQFTPIVVGVVNDYHQVSLKKSIDPAIFYCSKYQGEFYSIRFRSNNVDEVTEHVRAAWAKAFPGNPFDYFFLDDYFNRQYENEQKFGKLFTTFSVLAVIVSCLGLFGLSAYTAAQRTKEIGIRKALGSSENGIFLLLSQEYMKLVGLSILIATPATWWIMTGWIQTFSYRAEVSPLVFFIAGVFVLLVALVTVSFQTWKAARINPVQSLKYE